MGIVPDIDLFAVHAILLCEIMHDNTVDAAVCPTIDSARFSSHASHTCMRYVVEIDTVMYTAVNGDTVCGITAVTGNPNAIIRRKWEQQNSQQKEKSSIRR